MEQNNTKIYNIMGCRETKAKNGYNVALVHDDVDNSKKYANIFIKKEKARLVETDEGKKGITIFIPIFEDKEEKCEGKCEQLPQDKVPFTNKKSAK